MILQSLDLDPMKDFMTCEVVQAPKPDAVRKGISGKRRARNSNIEVRTYPSRQDRKKARESWIPELQQAEALQHATLI